MRDNSHACFGDPSPPWSGPGVLRRRRDTSHRYENDGTLHCGGPYSGPVWVDRTGNVRCLPCRLRIVSKPSFVRRPRPRRDVSPSSVEDHVSLMWFRVYEGTESSFTVALQVVLLAPSRVRLYPSNTSGIVPGSAPLLAEIMVSLKIATGNGS